MYIGCRKLEDQSLRGVSKVMSKRNKDNYVVRSIANALELLECFKGERDELGVTELSQQLGLPKNNIFRMLATLSAKGYVEQNPVTGTYRLGIKTFELGQVFRKRMGLLKQARPVLEKLETQCGESSYLAIIQEGMVVYVDMVETTHSVRIVPKLGQRVPAYCTAVGKAQLAYESHDEIERIIEKLGFTKLTPNTITDKQQLMEHLAEVTRNGYATDNEELEMEVKCVAAPIRDYTGKVVAGICVSGPVQRMTQPLVESELVGMIKQAALEISERLGYSPA